MLMPTNYDAPTLQNQRYCWHSGMKCSSCWTTSQTNLWCFGEAPRTSTHQTCSTTSKRPESKVFARWCWGCLDFYCCCCIWFLCTHHLTLWTVCVSLGSFEEQFPKLLLDGGKVAASLKSDEADAIGKVGLNGLKFFFFLMIQDSFAILMISTYLTNSSSVVQ